MDFAGSVRIPVNSPRHLYVHVPFCPSKCSYCAFVTHVGSLKLMPDYLNALMIDLRRQAAGRWGEPLETVYIGGGTPSLMHPEQVHSLLCCVEQAFGLHPDCEITMEAHPDTVNREKVHGFREAGVNRISFGGESLQAGELAALGRGHTPGRVLDAVAWSGDAGFRVVALDLMYGLPGQTRASWEETLRLAVNSGLQHLSLYPLSIEPRTVFARRRVQGRLVVPADDAVSEMYATACGTLRDRGFQHYEVASWSLPGMACRHNLAYWLNQQFYAAGVGAHGYLKPYRTERMTGTRKYIDAMTSGLDPVIHREPISAGIELQETIMLRLRLLLQGLQLEDIQKEFGVDLTCTRGR
ncbi:MAG: radical SAM family heme chaperone HemW, partial [Chloroflexota bacterium]